MTNVLPQSQPIDQPVADDEGVPYSEYVRSIAFVDSAPQSPEQAPVHVVRRVLFDGVLAPCRVHKDGMTVDLSVLGGTVVTMQVHREDLQMGDGVRPWLIGDRRVLTPEGDGWAWSEVDQDWVICSMYVARVEVR